MEYELCPASKLATIMQHVIACAEAEGIPKEEQRMGVCASRMVGEDAASVALLGFNRAY